VDSRRLSKAQNHNLPVNRVRLVGRETDQAAVRELVMRNDGSLVTLVGTGGCGKTQLVLHVAAELAPRFPSDRHRRQGGRAGGLSRATAALADGDDVRARLLAP
jgi:predicted ribonuclease YlaK